jgi:hypothetical protein
VSAPGFGRPTITRRPHHDGPSARRRRHQRRWTPEARETVGALYFDSGNQRADADVPEVRRSAELQGDRHQRRQADRAVGLLPVSGVRAACAPRTDPHAEFATIADWKRLLAEQSAIILTDVTVTGFAVIVGPTSWYSRSAAVEVESCSTFFGSVIPVTSTCRDPSARCRADRTYDACIVDTACVLLPAVALVDSARPRRSSSRTPTPQPSTHFGSYLPPGPRRVQLGYRAKRRAIHTARLRNETSEHADCDSDVRNQSVVRRQWGFSTTLMHSSLLSRNIL